MKILSFDDLGQVNINGKIVYASLFLLDDNIKYLITCPVRYHVDNEALNKLGVTSADIEKYNQKQ